MFREYKSGDDDDDDSIALLLQLQTTRCVTLLLNCSPRKVILAGQRLAALFLTVLGVRVNQARSCVTYVTGCHCHVETSSFCSESITDPEHSWCSGRQGKSTVVLNTAAVQLSVETLDREVWSPEQVSSGVNGLTYTGKVLDLNVGRGIDLC